MIVAEGALSARGMVSFKDNFSGAEIDAIRAYVVDRAHAASPPMAPSP
jgi:quinohemoprotein ethanol dehydrogenase